MSRMKETINLEQQRKAAQQKPKPRQPNRVFALQAEFLAACKRAGVNPTKRQASKFRRRIGLAYREGR